MGPNGVRVKNGKQLKLRLFVGTSHRPRPQDAPYIKGWLNAIGIKVTMTGDVETASSPPTSATASTTCSCGAGESSLIPTSSSRCSPAASVRTAQVRTTRLAGRTASTATRTYDKLYHQQQSLDGAARAKVVKQMQKMLYDDDPYAVLYYPNDTQAYRSDKFTGFAPSPEQAQRPVPVPGDSSAWSYRCIRPAGSNPSLTDRNIGCEHEIGAVRLPAPSGVNGGLIGGIAAAVVVLGGGGVAGQRRAARRRPRTSGSSRRGRCHARGRSRRRGGPQRREARRRRPASAGRCRSRC